MRWRAIAEAARALLEERDAFERERGEGSANTRHYDGYIAMLLEDPAIGLGKLARVFGSSVESGDAATANLFGMLLMELQLDAGDMAAASATSAQIPPAPDLLDSSADLDTVRSRLALVHGDVGGAVAHAQAAIELLEPTEWLTARGYAWWRLADARLALGERAGAREAAEAAVARFEEKGDVVSAAKVRRLLDQIAASEASPA